MKPATSVLQINGGGCFSDYQLIRLRFSTIVKPLIKQASAIAVLILLACTCLCATMSAQDQVQTLQDDVNAPEVIPAVSSNSGKAIPVAIKTNILYDALLSPSLGVEVGLSRRFTLDLSGSLNLWSVEGHTWKHWQVQPELRYWLCQRFAGHFIGVEAHTGQFNVGNIDLGVKFLGTDFGKLKDARYQGWQAGAGLVYGYSWVISRHWNVEAEIGVGYSWTKFDSYPCASCGTLKEKDARHNYIGVTKAALAVEYIF